MCVWLYFVLHWSSSTELLVYCYYISDGSHGHLISCLATQSSTLTPNILLVKDTFHSYNNSNYVVWHSPLKLNACLLSSSKHAFTGFWSCTTTATGSVKVFPSHALPPRKINCLARIRQQGWALTLQAVCNWHGAAVETARDAGMPGMMQHHTERQNSLVWWMLMAGRTNSMWCSVQSATVYLHWI